MTREIAFPAEDIRQQQEARKRPFCWTMPLDALLSVSHFQETTPLPYGFEYEQDVPPGLLQYRRNVGRWPSGIVYGMKKRSAVFQSLRIGDVLGEEPLIIPEGTLLEIDEGMHPLFEEPLKSWDITLIRYLCVSPKTRRTVAIAIFQHERVPDHHVLCYGR